MAKTNDVSLVTSDSSAAASGEMDLAGFQAYAKAKYDISRDTAALIFARNKGNGGQQSGTLNSGQLATADRNLNAFDTIVDNLGITHVSEEAAEILTGDIDGEMITKNVKILIDKNILNLSDSGELSLTDNEGQEFYNFLYGEDGDTNHIRAKHIIHHLESMEHKKMSADYANYSASTDKLTTAAKILSYYTNGLLETHNDDASSSFEGLITMHSSGLYQTKTVGLTSYNTISFYYENDSSTDDPANLF
ncbi:MAG: hypothetical protein CMD81_03945 [Gammaproteobacteria bacterium]|nr:hypothetical protein [Gammaproteobacteria bacterium]HBF06823.1 hypothetical protein [Gammaproteobacteria bacterium]|tara:strand:+ start:658 stop:1404 length:747 start_codon:yes stop_codon:yes gene_type:complete